MYDPTVSQDEGFCIDCGGYTTNYNNYGECREHGTEVTADPWERDIDD